MYFLLQYGTAWRRTHIPKHWLDSKTKSSGGLTLKNSESDEEKRNTRRPKEKKEQRSHSLPTVCFFLFLCARKKCRHLVHRRRDAQPKTAKTSLTFRCVYAIIPVLATQRKPNRGGGGGDGEEKTRRNESRRLKIGKFRARQGRGEGKIQPGSFLKADAGGGAAAAARWHEQMLEHASGWFPILLNESEK